MTRGGSITVTPLPKQCIYVYSYITLLCGRRVWRLEKYNTVIYILITSLKLDWIYEKKCDEKGCTVDTPVLVVAGMDGRVRAVVGASGGPRIISSVLTTAFRCSLPPLCGQKICAARLAPPSYFRGHRNTRATAQKFSCSKLQTACHGISVQSESMG